MRPILARGLCLSLLAVGWCEAAPPTESGHLVLDETCYWRYYPVPGRDRVSAEALRAEGEATLGKRRMASLGRNTRKRFRNADWTREDWMKKVTMVFPRVQMVSWGDFEDQGNAWDERRRADLLASRPPGDNWTALGFDDSSWPRQRLPLLVGMPSLRQVNMQTVFYAFEQTGWSMGCFRAHFVVPDPQKAGELTLRLTYRGGARVFLNGREIARGHLPPGKIGAGVPASDYPKEAYVAFAHEMPPALAKGRERLVGDFHGGFAASGEAVEFRKVAGAQLNRKGWQRLGKVRNRVLGPVRIDPGLLRKGKNVLAVQVRASHYHPVVLSVRNWYTNSRLPWYHVHLIDLELRSRTGGIPSALRRRPGVQVWVEDVHKRMVSTEFLEPGASGGTVRFVGAPNGTYSALLAVGTDRPLAGLKVACGDLKAVGGAGVLPAAAVRALAMAPHPLTELPQLGRDRNTKMDRLPGLIDQSQLALWRHDPSSRPAWELPWPQQVKRAAKLAFFDHISDAPPGRIAAGNCQPVWLSLKVPADAAPGTYRGTVTVRAEGIDAVTVPAEAEIFGWRVPDPGAFQTVVALEQSPFGVAKQYGVPLWSDRHLELTAASFRQLARAGNDWLVVPVVQHTEFGNGRRTMIPCVRRKDGSFRFDFAILDRYLAAAVKHMGGGAAPRVIVFVVMPPENKGHQQRYFAKVEVTDEATGKPETLHLTPTHPEYRPYFTALAEALYAHMKSRGLESRMFWGYPWDGIQDPALIRLLAECAPDVFWASGSHARVPGDTFKAVATIYGRWLADVNRRGWKNRHVNLSSPRGNNGVSTAEGVSPPFAYRLAVDRALVAGLNGVGRLGADFWADSYTPFVGYYPASMGCSAVLWPGENGAESSARYEALLEGVQEAEARIFLEQALERKLLPAELSARAAAVLAEHNRQTLHIPSNWAPHKVMEACAGWQERSRRIYRCAAEAAEKVPLDVWPDRVEVDVPVRGRAAAPVRLRNWTGRARSWKASTDDPWIVLERARGTVRGQAPLGVVVDGARFRPGQTRSGTVSVTDPATGRTFRVKITAKAGEVFGLLPADRWVMNVTAGSGASRACLLLNHSGAELRWAGETSVPWLGLNPASGKVPPGGRAAVTVTARPPDKQPATHKAAFTIREGPGEAVRRVEATIVVIPPYRRPEIPAGRAVPLAKVDRSLLVSHGCAGYLRGGRPVFTATQAFHHATYKVTIGTKTFADGMWALPPQTTVYRLDEGDFTAFSAQVGVNPATSEKGDPGIEVNFEVHVDGRVRAQSGLMKAGDEPRLLVVTGLDKAKRLKLVCRAANFTDHGSKAGWPVPWVYCNWADARLYKAGGG